MRTISGIRINPYDVSWMVGLGRYGVLSTEDAFDFYPSYKPNSVQKRLRLLSQNLLTRMTKLQVWWSDDKASAKGGRIPMEAPTRRTAPRTAIVRQELAPIWKSLT